MKTGGIKESEIPSSVSNVVQLLYASIKKYIPQIKAISVNVEEKCIKCISSYIFVFLQIFS